MELDPLPSAQHVRLFQLETSTSHSTPAISIQIFTLDKCPPFEAISFTWEGSGKDWDGEVLWNGQSKGIPESLMQCLLQLRGERKADALYWAFTISLDRHLDRDVFRPVADIAPVFAKASRTICWLGTPSPPSLGASAFDLIPTLCQARRAVLKDVASLKEMQSCGFGEADPISILGEYQRLTSYVRPEAWQSIEELLRMRFFSSYLGHGSSWKSSVLNNSSYNVDRPKFLGMTCASL